MGEWAGEVGEGLSQGAGVGAVGNSTGCGVRVDSDSPPGWLGAADGNRVRTTLRSWHFMARREQLSVWRAHSPVPDAGESDRLKGVERWGRSCALAWLVTMKVARRDWG